MVPLDYTVSVVLQTTEKVDHFLRFKIAQCLAYSLLEPAAPGSNPRGPKILSMLLRLINGAAKRKVDSGLKMLIEHI